MHASTQRLLLTGRADRHGITVCLVREGRVITITFPRMGAP